MAAAVEARERLTKEDYRKLHMGGKKTCHFDPLGHTNTHLSPRIKHGQMNGGRVIDAG